MWIHPGPKGAREQEVNACVLQYFLTSATLNLWHLTWTAVSLHRVLLVCSLKRISQKIEHLVGSLVLGQKRELRELDKKGQNGSMNHQQSVRRLISQNISVFNIKPTCLFSSLVGASAAAEDIKCWWASVLIVAGTPKWPANSRFSWPISSTCTSLDIKSCGAVTFYI